MDVRKLKKESDIRAAIKFTKEEILKEKQNILKIVEMMLEKNVSKDWFLKCCEKLSQADYDDIVEERIIELLCGYPLCNKNIKELKQKFHISTKVNKVYDITERKYFCSNECYKASSYVKVQLSTDPFWMREKKALKVKLISKLENKGIAGEEVDFGYPIRIKNEKELSAESILQSSSDLLEKEIEKCSEDLKDFKIVENTFKTPYEFKADLPSTTVEGLQDETDSSEDGTEDSSSDSDSNAKFFTDYDNPKSLSNKWMPVSKESKKSVLISALNSAVGGPCGDTTQGLSLHSAHHILASWMTEETIKYLVGERKMHSMKADILFEKFTGNYNLSPEEMKSMKADYVDLCLKLDEQEEGDIVGLPEMEVESSEMEMSKFKVETEAWEKLNVQSEISKAKLPQIRKKCKKSGRKKKSVTFAPTAKTENIDDAPEGVENISLTSLPMIDSRSQNALRKQIVSNRLKIAYTETLPLIEQSFKLISQEVRNLVETFSLSPSNVTCKPKEWKLVALIMYRILSQTVMENICDDEKFLRVFERTKLPINASLDDIDELIKDLLGAQQLQRLQGSCTDLKQR